MICFGVVFGSLSSDRHLRVIQPCTSTSDVKCVCDEGYTCTEMVPYSDNCRYCRKMEETTKAGDYADKGGCKGGGGSVSMLHHSVTFSQIRNVLDTTEVAHVNT